jgi:hypothetical protein
MANLEINSANLFVRLSETSVADALGVSGLSVVCEETSGLSSSSNVSERKTKCGTITNTDTPTYRITGSGVAAADLPATAISAQQLMIYQLANTLLYVAYVNTVSGTIAAGEITYLTGQCRVANVNITSDLGDGVVTYDYELAITGTPDLTP